ncbi:MULTISPECIES: protein-L-isoaspartate(D-aspartate) O-methyltransferase [unclassified Campylobacter]|uniref:protein-L-isoaspartate(D-aspartate) O-methyltransferase n=1 Tax=unclassified Campylobacter TaxID=2593542 RepID=UPI001237F80D|nr:MULTISPECIES: protein-L-isoaspartate(D-aspartate) O-methyltransferase [unclassified Campylobacter]KAA6227256.1 protein-L-isoaspartate(D-aspartate) O-methyltransferase [Campylobacter sp. LR286c]KAA6227871.1 protein-L-isoaspartate(D-aspartate) O-methyltransferase [Campylobacter sp. LR185c]KAA6228279.1 protein-L-isoaspartate(D-aspartate) O-methyltransferase [Campylobacter sp. LR196d]KAA6229279.1 protein-L-isoaspartate(D-aspartate) O-methyltransferase [Campylobacter sp. LR291e]KAA6231085.1 prot
MDAFEYKRCKNMAEEISQQIFINETLFNAFCEVPREIFSPLKTHAYRLDAMPLANSQWISSPLTVAKMTMALEFKDADSVLEIGCGSGYQAAILSKVIRRVFSIERIEKLAKTAAQTFRDLGYSNINVRFDDGQNGWKNYAPYDRILFSAYTKQIPEILLDQLSDRGILVAPILHDNRQFITRLTKNGTSLQREILEECLFVPVLDGKESF